MAISYIVERRKEVVKVLTEGPEEMSLMQIVTAVAGSPQQTKSSVYQQVYHTIKVTLRDLGESSPFKRSAFGKYVLRGEKPQPPSSVAAPTKAVGRQRKKRQDEGWCAVTVRVMREKGEPMRACEIASDILDKGYYQTDSPRPSTCVTATINSSIKKDGSASPFVNVKPGLFGLRELIAPSGSLTSKKESDNDTTRKLGIITSYGLNWQVSDVDWDVPLPRLRGTESAKAKPIDFSKQRGIYALYRGDKMIYVGRAINTPIGMRLKAHMADRLTGQWDSWSWFGFMGVTDNGELYERTDKYTLDEIFIALETVNIELAEPLKNRRSGDGIEELGYIQFRDPAIRHQQAMRHMNKLFSVASESDL